jgi:hypothetical protein
MKNIDPVSSGFAAFDMFDDNVDNNLHTEPKKQTSPELFLCLNLL